MTFPAPSRRDHELFCRTEGRQPVRDGVVPERSTSEPRGPALPAELIHLLISRVGPDEHEVAEMTKDEAVARLPRYWTEEA